MPLCWLIRKVQGTPFSHVYTRVYWPSAGQDIIYQASGTKVNAESFTHFQTHSKIVAEFTFAVELEVWEKIARFMISQIDKPYSMKEILGLAVRILGFKLGLKIANPFQDGPASYVCSELGADIYKLINPASTLEPEQIGPKELYESLCK